MLTPSMFTGEYAHTLFFSGGQDGRISTSFPLWDAMDREFEDLTVDQANPHRTASCANTLWLDLP